MKHAETKREEARIQQNSLFLLKSTQHISALKAAIVWRILCHYFDVRLTLYNLVVTTHVQLS
jgi:hypothetical protein